MWTIRNQFLHIRENIFKASGYSPNSLNTAILVDFLCTPRQNRKKLRLTFSKGKQRYSLISPFEKHLAADNIYGPQISLAYNNIGDIKLWNKRNSIGIVI